MQFRLKELRQKKKITQVKMAIDLNMNQNTINNVVICISNGENIILNTTSVIINIIINIIIANMFAGINFIL